MKKISPVSSMIQYGLFWINVGSLHFLYFLDNGFSERPSKSVKINQQKMIK